MNSAVKYGVLFMNDTTENTLVSAVVSKPKSECLVLFRTWDYITGNGLEDI